jgi:elongation factor G
LAFYTAASRALRSAIEEVGSVLLEPVMRFEVTVPETYMGDVISNLNSRRAIINELDFQRGVRLIRGHVPLAEMFGYATVLRSLTQGRGNYAMEPLEYRPVPAEVCSRVA